MKATNLKALLTLAALACCFAAPAHAKDTRFWNLTANAITELRLSPAGANDWGADQTANDSDHSVDHDERLKITTVKSGVFDVKFTDRAGRECVVKDIAVKEGAVFSIDEKKVAGCGK
jgi:hypothetical protein